MIDLRGWVYGTRCQPADGEFVRRVCHKMSWTSDSGFFNGRVMARRYAGSDELIVLVDIRIWVCAER